jgi:hypothetical protein
MSHVSDLQLEDLPGVQLHLISKLKQAGIQSVLDLAEKGVENAETKVSVDDSKGSGW